MALCEWMVPELTESAAVQLEHNKRVLRAHAHSEPERISQLACSVMEQAALQQSIIRKATAHIAELELVMLLAPPMDADPGKQISHGWRRDLPWYLKALLRLHGFRFVPS